VQEVAVAQEAGTIAPPAAPDGETVAMPSSEDDGTERGAVLLCENARNHVKTPKTVIVIKK
jgi:hypothetical protein